MVNNTETPPGIVLEAPQATKTDTFRLGYIDGLRAVAMLMVMACHGWEGFFYTAHVSLFGQTWELAHIQAAGYRGVDLFLIVSGFCLFFPYAGDAGRPEPTLSEFFLKRIRRIVPPYYASVLVCTIAAWFHFLPPPNEPWVHHWLLRCLAYHAVLLHNTQPAYIGAFSATMWSMGLEWQLYFFFPLLFVAYLRWNARWTFLIVLALNGWLRSILQSQQIVNEDILMPVLAWSAFGRAFEFALGMYVASLMAQQRRLGRSPLHPMDGIAIAAAVLEAAWDMRREVLVGWNREDMIAFLPELAWAVCFASAIFFGGRPGAVNRMLSWPPLMRLGLFSYSIYLVQGMLLMPLCATLKPLLPPGLVQFAAEWLLIVPLLIAIGYLFHLAFERPYMSLPSGERRPLTLARVFLPHLERPVVFWSALCAGTCALIFALMAVMTWHAPIF